jgi:hypothetical protein
MRGNEKSIEVVDEKSITIKGQNGKKDTIIYIETEKVGVARPMGEESIAYTSPKLNYTLKETYFERLHTNTIKELEEYDKKIVAEAFRNNNVVIPQRTITIWQTIKYIFGKYDPHQRIKERFIRSSYDYMKTLDN